MRSCRADRRDDTLTNTRQDGLLTGTTHQLLDVGTHRHARLGNELDTILCHGSHRRRIDYLRVYRHLHRLKDITTRKVDSRSHLKVEHDIGLLGRHEGMYDIRHITTGQVVGFQLVGVELQTRLRAFDHRRDDNRGRHLTPAHQHQLQEADSHARNQRREPKAYGDKIEDDPNGDQRHKYQ